MKDSIQSSDNISDFSQLIVNILKKYDLAESYVIIEGIQLVGIENIQFWLNFVSYVKQNKNLEEIYAYITFMKNIDRETLQTAIEVTKREKDFSNFENFLLKDLIESNSIRK